MRACLRPCVHPCVCACAHVRARACGRACARVPRFVCVCVVCVGVFARNETLLST